MKGGRVLKKKWIKKLPAEKLELTAEFKKKGGHANVSH